MLSIGMLTARRFRLVIVDVVKGIGCIVPILIIQRIVPKVVLLMAADV